MARMVPVHDVVVVNARSVRDVNVTVYNFYIGGDGSEGPSTVPRQPPPPPPPPFTAATFSGGCHSSSDESDSDGESPQYSQCCDDDADLEKQQKHKRDEKKEKKAKKEARKCRRKAKVQRGRDHSGCDGMAVHARHIWSRSFKTTLCCKVEIDIDIDIQDNDDVE